VSPILLKKCGLSWVDWVEDHSSVKALRGE
jgi:hypothetical protein